MAVFVHFADISNPFKPFQLCQKWADMISTEFLEQGDRELREGLEVSPMCDRNSFNLYASQVGFVGGFVSPLVISMVSLFPTLKIVCSNCTTNIQAWGELRKNELLEMNAHNMNEEIGKLDDSLAKFQEKMSIFDDL